MVIRGARGNQIGEQIVANSLGISTKRTWAVLHVFWEAVASALAEGETVNLEGFGVFAVKSEKGANKVVFAPSLEFERRLRGEL